MICNAIDNAIDNFQQTDNICKFMVAAVFSNTQQKALK